MRIARAGAYFRGVVKCGEIRDEVFPGAFVVMPDHFHGLIRIGEGRSELGHVVGAFKAAVSRRIRRGDSPVAHDVRIWLRNYYEMIVRSAVAEKITGYIRRNPWKCVAPIGNGF
jgi:REP element-mobilizing transposase RayT